MNNFRALSESRFFIGTGLLLLLLALLAPVCNVGAASQMPDHDSAHQQSHNMALSHADKTAHQCCTDFGVQQNKSAVALPSSSPEVDDVGVLRYQLVALEYVVLIPAPLPVTHHFRFNATGLPRYLITQRLRV